MPPATSRESVTAHSGGLSLEGLFLNNNGGRPPVVALAPHPLYGGSMDNPVIAEAADLFARRGHPVLAINYRGVGRSEGAWSGGAGEMVDAGAAAEFALLETAQPGVIFCGYSFGAWVALQCAVKRGDVRALVLISPPTAMFDFSPLKSITAFHAFVGDRDEYCDLDSLRLFAGDSCLTVIPGADHFYSRHLHDLAEAIEKHVADFPE